MRTLLSRQKANSIYLYKLTSEELTEISTFYTKRSSFILQSGELLMSPQILSFGSMKDLYDNWPKFREWFIKLLDIKEQDIPASDMGTVNTKTWKKEIYPNISERENVQMVSEKPYPLNLLYRAIEKTSPDRVMDWEYILIYTEPNERKP